MQTKITLYHQSGCSKCRAVFAILEQSKIPFREVQYLETPPTESELDEILKKLKLEPEQLVRKGEDEYQQLAEKNMLPTTRAGWIKLMVSTPILIERPIVCDATSAVIGRPPENVIEWLNKTEKST